MDTINIKVDTNSLIEILQTCNLGRGCFTEPIKADSFAELDCITKIPETTDKIKFEISNNGAGPTPTLTCVYLENVSKKDIILPESNINAIYDEVFECSDNNIKIENRKLCITNNKNNLCSINLNKKTRGVLTNSFFSFTAIFTLAANGTTYCFSIDPIIRIRRER
ncbi:hypothetical protein [Aquimarina agarivorans]|uniref:hypothetical protein n=1 Tax=Aquimarina agarivorans TaxID=980584 RepID=UPI000248EA2D|nr:hypothetical protein [Aquimarina agarivorans]